MVLGPVAVVGATSRVGSALIPLLQESGTEVWPLATRRGSSRLPLVNLASLHERDCDRVLAGCSTIVLLGASTPGTGTGSLREYLQANVVATAAIASWARSSGVDMVYLSGGIVYANPGAQRLREEDPIGYSGMGGSYGTSKLLAEIALQDQVDLGLRLTVLRPSSLYGRRDYESGIIHRLLNEALTSGSITIEEPVSDEVNLVHVDDVAAAISGLIRAEVTGCFNVAADTVSISQVADACASALGQGSITVDVREAPFREPRRIFDLSSDRLRSAIRWKPMIGLEDGLREIIELKRAR